MDEKLLDEVKRFINENDYKVISAIAEKFDYHKNAAEWCTFCPDGFEIVDIYQSEEHLCEVIAKGSYHEGRMIVANPADGYEPDDEVYPCKFCFFIDYDKNGELVFSYYLDDNGELDLEATLITDDE